ncbi:MAG TPA: hypothetical protein VHZ49_00635 [Methylomirabilota bacterium]|jgi:hypothetical protein|nr:hypothetical protein [Methylomirabilota bacterium]
MTTYRFRIVALALSLSTTLGVAASSAAPSDDRILPIDSYTSEKGRMLARAHDAALHELNAQIYHCMPWVEIQKQSIGFFKPKTATQDDRYLSMRLFVEQEPSPQFATLAVEERASSMFSRYVGPMIRRMAAYVPPAKEPALDGFTVIVEWQKQHGMASGDRPVHETMAVFVDRAAVLEFLDGTLPPRELASRAKVMAWDGATALGPLSVSAWEDNFVSTYKVQNYQMEKGVTCQ